MTNKNNKLKKYEIVFEATAEVNAESQTDAENEVLKAKDLKVSKPIRIVGEDVTHKKRKWKFGVRTPNYATFGIFYILVLVTFIADKLQVLSGISLYHKSILVLMLLFFFVGGFVRLRRSYF